MNSRPKSSLAFWKMREFLLGSRRMGRSLRAGPVQRYLCRTRGYIPHGGFLLYQLRLRRNSSFSRPGVSLARVEIHSGVGTLPFNPPMHTDAIKRIAVSVARVIGTR